MLTMFDEAFVMSTFELDTIKRRNIRPQEIFLGVFALDFLPTLTELYHTIR